MTRPLDWLKDIPPSDINFKCALRDAAENELRQAIAYREPKPKNATAVKILRAELKRRGLK
jgi:hypothetical protein